MRKAFTLIELMVVMIIIGVLAGVGIKYIPVALGTSKALQLGSLMQEAEVAYNEAYAQVKYSLPVGGNGTTSTDSMNCFDFAGGANMTEANLASTNGAAGLVHTGDVSAGLTPEDLKRMYQDFDKTMRTSLVKSLGFKSSSKTGNVAGLYLPDNPRSKILVCGRGDARFLVITNVEGKLALKVHQNINGGAPTIADGAMGDKRVSIWGSKFAEFKNQGMSYAGHLSKFNKKDGSVEAIDPKADGDGYKAPYSKAAKIEKLPNTTLVYLLNPTGLNAGW